LSVEGAEINDASGLRFKLATLQVGSRAKVRLMRDGRERTVTARVDTPKEHPKRDERSLDGYHPLDGATVVNMSPALGEEIGVDPYMRGVMVYSLPRRSAARSNGLRPKDVILSLNGEDITSSRQLDALLLSAADTEEWSLSIDRNGKIYDVPVRYLPRVR